MRSKAEAERRVMASGLPFTTLRLPIVLGAGSNFSAPAILPMLASGDVPYVKRNNALVSVVCAGNLGPMVSELLRYGAQGRAFNAGDHHLRWCHLVAEYALAMGTTLHWRCRPMTDLVRCAADPYAMFWLTNGLFGAHFPSDTFEDAVPYTRVQSWRSAVQDEVANGDRWRRKPANASGVCPAP
jgi:uncharacterized protein YbjT (DUF2867 family)